MHIARVLAPLALCLAVSTVSADDRSLALDMINEARQAEGVAPLAWNPDLAAYAQFWANQMGAGVQPFGHAPVELRPQQGENIYEHQSGQCDVAFNTPLQTAVHEWLSQASLYDGQPLKTGQEHWLHWCRDSIKHHPRSHHGLSHHPTTSSLPDERRHRNAIAAIIALSLRFSHRSPALGSRVQAQGEPTRCASASLLAPA
ncbi:riboflavin aldehyde-forming enzyme [Ilyonectria robusta]